MTCSGWKSPNFPRTKASHSLRNHAFCIANHARQSHAGFSSLKPPVSYPWMHISDISLARHHRHSVPDKLRPERVCPVMPSIFVLLSAVDNPWLGKATPWLPGHNLSWRLADRSPTRSFFRHESPTSVAKQVQDGVATAPENSQGHLHHLHHLSFPLTGLTNSDLSVWNRD